MNIGLILFETIHQKKDIGSSRIRGHWLIKYWKEAEEYKIGKEYDAIIFQKVYRPEFARLYKGVKILDLCDPDWLSMTRDPYNPGYPFYEMLREMDVITCSSQGIYRFVKSITDKPVYYVPDRIDLEWNKQEKIHKGKAKTCIWYGYSHNIDSLKPVVPYILEMGLNVIIIADDFSTLANKEDDRIKKYERFVKWELKTVNDEIIKADFVIMPPARPPKGIYKSNNKITNAWSLGMPVAESPEDMERFIDEKERIKESELRLKEVKENYDVRQSIEQLKKIINEVQSRNKTNKAN